MKVVRECLYVPDGKPPPGYDDGRDFGILVTLLGGKGGCSSMELETAIRGVALMREAGEFEQWSPPVRRGAKLTMRVLYNTRRGAVQMLEQASAWYFKHDQPTGKKGRPIAIGKRNEDRGTERRMAGIADVLTKYQRGRREATGTDGD